MSAARPQSESIPAEPEPMTPIVEAHGLTAGYGDLAAVRDLDLHVNRGEIVALLGPNGAGKTTTILTLAGVLSPMEGEVRWQGSVVGTPLHRRAKDGMAFVPEEKSLFMRLSVRDNLRLGQGTVEAATELFPELQGLLGRRAGFLSGGEQQMVTLARALASRPQALLIDELSLGLAPVIVDRLLEALRRVAEETGVAVLMVEQQAQRAMTVADRWYLLRQGRVVDSGDADSWGDALARGYLSSVG